ncbi:WhiB family transcriptional regulator [Streptomyces sp. Amel2xC10]|uniref:WhiB family transcriptional regulator n=1 Tax=Streptomyces sp. Amel2xC10 TaxID=1305826 RepID=UPI000A089835|nr:WhiB family transcriptional regulator [Streptomyces sp. Amel2xC10]SMF85957.1 Transcription factor WhiB [Streptomyces sp. Amel2xC10]
MAYAGSVPDTRRLSHDWMADAACTNSHAVFDDPDREHEARTICVVRCPVRSECLAFTKKSESGQHKDHRESVAAGLTSTERFRLDRKSTRRADDPERIALSGHERCGTHQALLRHLWLDEPIDPKCWTGKLMRDRDMRGLVSQRETARTRLASEDAATQQPTPGGPTAARRAQPPVKGSTPHERRVYRLWSEGFDDFQIARRMALSTPQVQRVRERLGLLAHKRPA